MILSGCFKPLLVLSDYDVLVCGELEIVRTCSYYKKSLENPIWATQETKKQPGSPEHMRLLSDTGLIGVAISGTQGIANDLRKQFSFFHTNRTDWRSFWSPSTTGPSK